MKKLNNTIFAIISVFLFSVTFCFAQNDNWYKLHETLKKERDFEKETFNSPQKQIFQPKSDYWWEPDTVILYFLTGTGRVIYNYNTAGLRTRKATETLSGNIWNINSEFLWNYDSNQNLLSKTERRGNATGQVINYIRRIFTYNTQNLVETETSEYWVNEQWTIDTLIFQLDNDKPYLKTWTYGENHKPLTETLQIRENGMWRNITKLNYEYDESANLQTEILQNWLDNLNDWINYKRNFYTYDERNNVVTKIIEQYWDENQWINMPYYGIIIGPGPSPPSPTIRYKYTYDERDNVLSEQKQGVSDNDWIPLSGYSNTYNQYGNVLTHTESEATYQNDSIILKDYITTIYAYNENHNILTETQFYLWTGETIPHTLKIRTYDHNYNCISVLMQRWQNNGWRNEYLYTDTYDENGNCILATAQAWRNGGWQNENRNLFFHYNNSLSASEPFYCHQFEVSYLKIYSTVVLDLPIQGEILLYPNPTTGQLIIENGELIMENVEIFNVMGQKQKTIVNYQLSIVNSIDISHLSAGIYFVKIQTEKGEIIKKVIKQ